MNKLPPEHPSLSEVVEASRESTARFTTGPWKPEFHECYKVREVGSNGLIATCSFIGTPFTRRGEAEVKANANLIAAAPELYAALKRMTDWESSAVQHSDEKVHQRLRRERLEASRAALRKAEGQ